MSHPPLPPNIERMAIKRMEHVGIVVEDLQAAVEFFTELGLETGGTGQVEGDLPERIIGLDDVKAELAMMRAPEGGAEVELVKFHSPAMKAGDPNAPSNVAGLRHVSFLVEDIDAVVAGLNDRGVELVGELVRYGNSYRLCYVRGPEGIIVELAEALGS
jgi:catechol 2,3-dioxygenase-like lactoylglutathione lyase family enzyme